MWWNRNKKTLMAYLLVTGFSVLVTFLYYLFDHGLRDVHMTLLFLPSALTFLLLLVLSLAKVTMRGYGATFFHLGFACIWVYLLLQGIYTMAKTGSEWLPLFAYLGAGLLLASAVATFLDNRKKVVSMS